MLTASNFEAHVVRLVDPAATPEQRRILATEVRDSIEVVHTPDYGAFLRHFFPAFSAVLKNLTQPQDVDGPVNRTRSVILEVLNRLPHNEVLRDRVKDLLPLAMDVLRSDNEENAVTAIRIIFDLHKNFRPDLEPQVQSFLDFVSQLYSSFGDTIARLFPASGTPRQNTMVRSTSSFKVITECPLIVMFLFQLYPKFMQHNLPQLLPRMVDAIKVEISPERASVAPKATFHEFVAAQVKTVSFLCFILKQFQEKMKPYESSIPRSVVQLLQACPGDAVPIRKELLVATRHILGTSFRVGFYSQIDLLLNERVLVGTGRAAYETLRPLAYSFLADLVHFVRHDLSLDQLSRIIYMFSTNVHDRSLSFAVQSTSVRLLLNLVEGIVKKEDSEVRARHLLIRIMNTMVAKYSAIASQVPRLLETVSELKLRADAVTTGQALSTDPVVDPFKEFNDCKQLIKTLTLGLKTVVWSAIHTRVQASSSLAPHSVSSAPSHSSGLVSGSSVNPVQAPVISIPSVPGGDSSQTAAGTAAASSSSGQGIKPLLGGGVQPGLRSGLTEDECAILAGLLRSARECFRLYRPSVARGSFPASSQIPVGQQVESKASRIACNLSESTSMPVLAASDSGSQSTFGSPSNLHGAGSVPEEKEIYEIFAQIFTFLDVRSFQDVFGLRMPEMFEHIVENSAALTIPQHFLTHQNISKYFADILLNFLVSNISELAVQLHESDPLDRERSQKRSQALLRLFQSLFSSVALFSMNEPVLKPHLSTIVRECLSHASKAEDSCNFLYLLRALFKSLTNGKHELQFEMLYRDFMPLLEHVLNGLLGLYHGPQRIVHGELIVELCLTVPARPSTIFPYLSKQLKPMVWALEGGRDSVHMGLRQIEFWVDTLQPSYLNQLLADVEPGFTCALHRHIRPAPGNPFGIIALRILGKLGSRSRRSLAETATGDFHPKPDSALRMRLLWAPDTPLLLECDNAIRLAAKALMDDHAPNSRPVCLDHKIHSWRFLRSSIIPFLALDDMEVEDHLSNILVHGSASHLERIVQVSVGPGSRRENSSTTFDHAHDGRISHRSRATHRGEIASLHTLLVSLLSAAGMPDLNGALPIDSGLDEHQNSPREFAMGLCRYFALLHVKGLGSCAKKRDAVTLDSLPRTTEVAPPESLDPDIFVDVLIDVMSREKRMHADAGLACFVEFVDALLEFSGFTVGLPCSQSSPVFSNSSRTGNCDIDIEGMESVERPRDGVRFQGVDVVTKEPQKDQGSSASLIQDALVGSSSLQGGVAGCNPTEVRDEIVVVNGNDTEGSCTNDVVMESTEVGTRLAVGTNLKPDACSSGSHIQDEDVTIDMGPIRNGPGVDPVASGSPETPHLPSVVSSLVERLCHCCYQRRWHAKWAGASGFGAIIARVPADVFRTRASGSYEAHVVRALMFVVRDLAEDVSILTTGVARSSLRSLLELCHRGETLDTGANSSDRALRDVTVCIAVELTSESAGAREAAKDALRTLATTLKCPVSDVIARGKEQIIRPLQRPLRQLPFPTQVGYVDAVTFCLELEQPMLVEELFRAPIRDNFLNGVVELSEDPTFEKLTEAEEGIRHKLVENKLVQTMIVEHLTALRRYAMDLLRSITFKCSHFLRDPNNELLFRRIISVFFKNIQSRDKDVVEFAKHGLKQAIAQHPKPKEPLQTNLRPVLQTLAEYTKLTIPYLQGFSRVLELLSHWFNVQLGEKLLEHLARWTEPDKLALAKRWAPGTESLVGAAILDLFHLLPPAASKFLVQIVLMVLRLEAVLTVAGPGVAHLGLRGPGAASTSPYREPLLKFCNKHAPAAAVYFLSQLRDPQLRKLFLILLRADKAGELRLELSSHPERLLDATFRSTENATSNGLFTFCGVEIVDAISQRDTGWLARNRIVLENLVMYWNSSERLSRTRQEESLSLEQLREPQIIANCFLRQCREHPEDVELLFHLLHAFSLRTLNDFSFVKEFFADVVAKEYGVTHKRAIMNHFLAFFVNPAVTQELKVHALQFLILPMLDHHLRTRNASLGNDSTMVRADPFSGTSAGTQPCGKAGESELGRSLASNTTVDDPHGNDSHKTEADKYHEVSEVNRVVRASAGHSLLDPGTGTTARNRTGVGAIGKQGEDPLPFHGTVSTPSVCEHVLDDSILQRLMKDLLDQPEEVTRRSSLSAARYDEPLSAELLQLATLLVQYMPTELGRYRKELIKFGWNHLKREDSVAKQWAFVNVSRFFEAYQAPDKIILQVYVALLRTCQPEGKHLVRQALDILTPALPKRLFHNMTDHKYPIWIRYTKKILLEEGHSLLHLVHIWQLIVRHAELFYTARALFVPIMVTSLSRIGLGANTAAENRRLALDLADLIISWDFKRQSTCIEGHYDSGGGPLSLGLKRSRDEVPRQGNDDPGSGSGQILADTQSERVPSAPENSQERPSKLRKADDGSAKSAGPAPAVRGTSESVVVDSSGNHGAATGLPAHSAALRPTGPGSGNHIQQNRDIDDFRPNPNMADVVVNFLTQAAFRPMERRESRVISQRCISLIGSALRIWPETPVRLGFLEKHLELGAADRSASASGSVARSKGAGALSGSGSAADSRRGSGTGHAAGRAEKGDGQNVDRALLRASVLSVAVELSLVALGQQGAKFVGLNTASIRAMVAPSLVARNIQSASLFARLLSKLLQVCPMVRSKSQSFTPGPGGLDSVVAVSPPSSVLPNTKPCGAGDSEHISATAEKSASVVTGTGKDRFSGTLPGGIVSSPGVPSASNPVGRLPMSNTPTDAGLDSGQSTLVSENANTAAVNSVYSLVESTIERCLKSPDVPSMHCGLVALQALVEAKPEEFIRYQDLVIKSLHRMAKDSLQISQPPNASVATGTSSSVAASNMPAKEKVVPSAPSTPAGLATAHHGRGGIGGLGDAADGLQAGGGGVSEGLGTGNDTSVDGQSLILGLSLLASNITSLEPQQRRSFFQVLSVLIDRCVQVKVLLEIVRIVENWICWKPSVLQPGLPSSLVASKEPLGPKEKVTFLLKMCVFERITGNGSGQLMEAYLDIVLRVFGVGNGSERRPELLHRLERAFMIGLKSPIASVRRRFFSLFHNAADRSPAERLRYVIAKQDWEPLADSFWIGQALELLLAVVDPDKPIRSDRSNASLPYLHLRKSDLASQPPNADSGNLKKGHISGLMDSNSKTVGGAWQLLDFIRGARRLRTGDLVTSLRDLLYMDSELAHCVWVAVFPCAWHLILEGERGALESALSGLFAKEYLGTQMSWPRNVVQVLLEGASRCEPLPSIAPELLQHLGSRFGAWHIVIPFLERRAMSLKTVVKDGLVQDPRILARSEAELEATLDSMVVLYRQINDRDMLAGVWKLRSRGHGTSLALCLEQQGLFARAQGLYSDAIMRHEADIQVGNVSTYGPGQQKTLGLFPGIENGGPIGKAEVCLWEERWIECARELCQWEVLTEFSRSCVHTELLHDCLWRVGDWSALKELLLKHPVDDGPQLKLYLAYGYLQENKLDMADISIQQGMQRALEKYCTFPVGFGALAVLPVLVQFQQLVELQESSKVMAELNALSRHGAGNTNIEQRIDNLRLVLHTWRERLPNDSESLTVWGDILSWRNHVHHIVVNVLEALKDAANQTVQAANAQGATGLVGGTTLGGSKGIVAGHPSNPVQPSVVQAAAAIAAALSQQPNLVMGVNETAWSVNRFAHASRKQGLPDIALTILHKLYPFGTMELNEYFFKTKESAKANLAGPSGLSNSAVHGLNELNRCNMDLFSSQQKAELFSLKGRFLMQLNRDDDVADVFSTALSVASDVGSAWLAWAKHSDAIQAKAASNPGDFSTPTAVAVDPASPSSPLLMWREAAANCYLHAVQYGSRKARTYIPRALRLLTLDVNDRRNLKILDMPTGESLAESGNPLLGNSIDISSSSKGATDSRAQPVKYEGVQGVFMAFVETLPPWVWLPWLAQIVPMLARSEVYVARAILVKVAQVYPQAVFFPLRGFLEERKNIDSPTRSLMSDALRTSRPNTPALLPAAASQQYTNAMKALTVAQSNAEIARKRFSAAQSEFTKACELAQSRVGTAGHSALLASTDTLKEQLANAQKAFERAMSMYQNAVTQRKIAQAQMESASQGPQRLSTALGRPIPPADDGAGIARPSLTVPAPGHANPQLAPGNNLSQSQSQIRAVGQIRAKDQVKVKPEVDIQAEASLDERPLRQTQASSKQVTGTEQVARVSGMAVGGPLAVSTSTLAGTTASALPGKQVEEETLLGHGSAPMESRHLKQTLVGIDSQSSPPAAPLATAAPFESAASGAAMVTGSALIPANSIVHSAHGTVSLSARPPESSEPGSHHDEAALPLPPAGTTTSSSEPVPSTSATQSAPAALTVDAQLLRKHSPQAASPGPNVEGLSSLIADSEASLVLKPLSIVSVEPLNSNASGPGLKTELPSSVPSASRSQDCGLQPGTPGRKDQFASIKPIQARDPAVEESKESETNKNGPQSAGSTVAVEPSKLLQSSTEPTAHDAAYKDPNIGSQEAPSSEIVPADTVASTRISTHVAERLPGTKNTTAVLLPGAKFSAEESNITSVPRSQVAVQSSLVPVDGSQRPEEAATSNDACVRSSQTPDAARPQAETQTQELLHPVGSSTAAPMPADCTASHKVSALTSTNIDADQRTHDQAKPVSEPMRSGAEPHSHVGDSRQVLSLSQAGSEPENLIVSHSDAVRSGIARLETKVDVQSALDCATKHGQDGQVQSQSHLDLHSQSQLKVPSPHQQLSPSTTQPQVAAGNLAQTEPMILSQQASENPQLPAQSLTMTGPVVAIGPQVHGQTDNSELRRETAVLVKHQPVAQVAALNQLQTRGQMPALAVPLTLEQAPSKEQATTDGQVMASRQAHSQSIGQQQAQVKDYPQDLSQQQQQKELRLPQQLEVQAQRKVQADSQMSEAKGLLQHQVLPQVAGRGHAQVQTGQASTPTREPAHPEILSTQGGVRAQVQTTTHAQARANAQGQPLTQSRLQAEAQAQAQLSVSSRGQAQAQNLPKSLAHEQAQSHVRAHVPAQGHVRLVSKVHAPSKTIMKEETQTEIDSRGLAHGRESASHAQSHHSMPSHAHLPSVTNQKRLTMSPKTPYEHADWVMANLVTSHQPLYIELEGVAQDLAQRMKPQQEEQLLGLMNALLHRCYQLSVQAGKEVAPSLRSALEEVSRMCFGTVSSATAPAVLETSSGNMPNLRAGSSGMKIQPSIADLKSAFEAELAPQTSVDFPTRIEPFIARLRRWKNIFQRRVDAMPEFQRLELLSRRLIELHNSDIEVFGQYLDAEAGEPSPDTHVKIDRFAADTRVIRRHSGAARGVAIIGTDGKTYNFMLETSANAACQPTEERAAQLCRLINASFFAKDAEACRRRIHVEVPILIPTGQHTRLVSDNPLFASLAEGLERFMESTGGNIDDPLMAFRNVAAEAYNRRHIQNPQQVPGRKDSIAARVEAYHSVCDTHIPDTCLSSWIVASAPTPNFLFSFRKTFAQTLGTASLVSYALAVGARRPQNILFSWSTGAVSNLHMRPLLSQRGLLECDEAVPFRLTRNIQQFLGPSGVHGPLFGSMAVTMRALRSNDELLNIYLNCVIRDELSSWTGSRGDGLSSSGGGGSLGAGTAIGMGPVSSAEEFEHLESRLAESVVNIIQRIGPVVENIGEDGKRKVPSGAGATGSGHGGESHTASVSDDVSRAVYDLIERAGLPEHLAQMDSSWHAWF